MATIRTQSRFAARLLLSGAPFAVALSLAMPAKAQFANTNAGTIQNAVNFGSGSTTVTGATSNTAGADTTNITLGNSRTILNWNSFNLSSGDTLNYVFNSNKDIVLNRVNGGSGTQINGNVSGYLGAAGGTVGGNVWFLDPTGIVVGGNATVNVGGLLLSTLGLTDADFGDDNSFNFSGTGGAVTVNADAGPIGQLNARNGAITMVAPSINFAGSADASTSIGLVGASNAQILFDANLGTYLGVTINQGSDQNTAVNVASTASFNAAPVASGGKTLIVGAGRGAALGSVLLGGTSADRVEFIEGDVVLYAAGDVTTTPKSIMSGGVVQPLGSPTGGGDVTIGAANVSAGSLNAIAADDMTISDSVSVPVGSARFEAGDLLSINRSVSTGRDYTVRADDFTGGFAFAPTFTGGAGIGDLNIEDTMGGLTVGPLTAPNDLRITTENGDLTISGALAATTGNIELANAGNNSAWGIAINAPVTTGTSAGRYVQLNPGGAVSQTAAGVITTNTLQGSGGQFSLDTANNSIVNLGPTSTYRDIRLKDASSGLTITGNLSLTDGWLLLTTPGVLSAGAVTINSTSYKRMELIGSSVALNGTTLTGGATFKTPVTIGGDVVFNVWGGTFGDIQFDSTISGDGLPGLDNFTITGSAGITGAVSGLNNLSINGNLSLRNNISVANNLTVGGQTSVFSTSLSTINLTAGGTLTLTQLARNYAPTPISLNLTGSTITTASIGEGSELFNNVTYNGATTLKGNILAEGMVKFNSPLTVTSGTRTISGTDVTLNGSVDALSLADTVNLTVTSNGAGTSDDVTFTGNVGATTALDTLTVNGVTRLNGGIFATTVAQNWNGPVILQGGGTKAFNGGSGAVAFNNTLDGGSTVNVNADGGITFNGLVGVGTRLVSLNTSGGGVTNLNGGMVNTTSAQSYSGSVSLGSNTLLDAQAGGIIFNAPVSGPFALDLRTPGDSFLNGAVNVASLTTDAGGNTNINNAAGVTTTGNQSYGDAVLLGANVTLSGLNSNFTTVAGNSTSRDLTLNFSGTTSTLSSGTLSNIRNLAVGGGGTTTLAGTIATSGSQTYTDAVSLAGNTALISIGAGTSGTITLGTVSGNGNNLAISNTAGSSLANPTVVTLNGALSGVNLLDVDTGTIDINASANAATLDLVALHGSIDVGASTGATGDTKLTAAGTIDGTGTVSGANVILSGAGGVGTSATPLKTAATVLTANSSSGAVNISEANGVILANAGALTNSAAGTYSVTASGPIVVNASVTGTNGVNLTATSGDLSFGSGVGATSTAGDINLASSGTMSGGGPLVAQNIYLTAADWTNGILSPTTLQEANNLSIRDTLGGLAISALTGLSAANGLTIETTNGGGLDVGGISAPGFITLISGSDLTLTDSINGGAGLVTLIAGGPSSSAPGTITQSGGVITAGLLGGASGTGSSATLNQSNKVTSLGNFKATGLSFVNSGGLNVIGTVSGGTGTATLRTSGGNLTLGASASVLGAEVVLSTDKNFVNNSGADAVSAVNRWLVYAAAPTGSSFGGLDSANTAIWNGSLTTKAPSTISGTHYVFAYQPSLTVTTLSASKTYGADLSGSTATLYSVSGFHPGVAGAFLADSASSAFSGTPLISSAGLAANADVSGGPYAVVATPGTMVSGSGYAISFVNNGVLTVTPKALTGTVIANNKTYDGGTSASGSITLNGVLIGDEVTASALLAFADKNAGSNKIVTISGGSLSGADASNYTLSLPASTLASIFQKALTGSVTTNNKIYDGTTTATGSVALTGVVAGDQVTASALLAFADKNAGNGKTVLITGGSLSGADAGNYTLSLPASALASIFQKALTGTVTANNKTYDGTTSATGSVNLNGVIAGDQVTASALLAFADKNAGNGKSVTISGASLSGADASNYTLSLPASTLASIFQKALTGTVTANNKTYDGTTSATGSVNLNGVIAGDQVTASALLAFADKNAGNDKTVTITGGSLSGSDAGNYTLSLPGSSLASIFQKALTGTVFANNKTYDGTTSATGSVSLTGVIAGDQVTASALLAFADKNAGNGKSVIISGGSLAGADAGNYTLNLPASTLASIFQKALTGIVTANDKTYDGTTSATGSVSLTGVIADDQVTASALLAFADKNAGNGKTVTITGGNLAGADASNYTLSLPASTLASIFQKALTGTITVNTKTYDGSTAASGSVGLTGVVAGDDVLGSASLAFADKNAGSGKTVLVTGGSLNGADAGNYTLTLSATALGDILKKTLDASVTANSKTYDGSAGTTGTVTLTGVVAGDDVAGSASFAFSDKDAGTGKTVNVSNGALTGADAGNYSLNLPANVLADILKRALTVSADAQSKTQGTADPTLTYAISQGSLVAGESLSGVLTRAPGEEPGSYAIEQGSLAVSANYELTFVGNTLTIEAKPQSAASPVLQDQQRALLRYLGELGARQSGPLDVIDERDLECEEAEQRTTACETRTKPPAP